MKLRFLLWGIAGALALAIAGFAAWLYMLPPAPSAAAAPPVPPEEVSATIEALKPPKRARPLIAIIGINEATEVTDYLVPNGILRRADVADVVALATRAGRVRLYPALSVEPDSTIAAFDSQHPEGADYVIVPAMEPDSDPAALEWIRQQATKGATIVGVCIGAKVVSEAGLLDGKRATTHWYVLKDMLKRHPTIEYKANRRFVVDGQLATTTGITASMPMMLTLIEAIAGRDQAESVARNLGVARWDARHASAEFRFNRAFAVTVLGNTLAFWNREELRMDLVRGIDEVSLALVADAWSRTYRSRVVTYAHSTDAIESRGGVRIIPDEVATNDGDGRLVLRLEDQPPARALDDALQDIANRFGTRTRDVVAMQLEYPTRQ